MSNMDVWQKVILPIIQFLVGPVVAGYTVWYLTNKKADKKDKDEAKRQFNAIISKLKRIIYLVEGLSKEVTDMNEYVSRIEEMKLGDFSNVLEDVGKVGGETNCLRLYEDLRGSVIGKIGKSRKQISSTASELNSLPKELMPPKIHGELLEIIESKQVELDLVKHKSLLKKIEKLI